MNTEAPVHDAKHQARRHREFLDKKEPGNLMVIISCGSFNEWVRKQRDTGAVDQSHIEIPDPMTEVILAESKHKLQAVR